MKTPAAIALHDWVGCVEHSEYRVIEFSCTDAIGRAAELFREVWSLLDREDRMQLISTFQSCAAPANDGGGFAACIACLHQQGS